MMDCCIFDLDGVIVDTARCHFQAWASLARDLGFGLTGAEGEATRGVSRMASLEIVLRAGGLENRFTEGEKQALAAVKNARYLDFVSRMTPGEVLPGVVAFLSDVRRCGAKVVLGSASKNAGTILDRCALRGYFDAVVDGNRVTRAKPDPEVFLRGAEAVGADPSACVVFEDAAAGIEAAVRAGMRSVGVGCSESLSKADLRIGTFEGFTFEKLLRALD